MLRKTPHPAKAMADDAEDMAQEAIKSTREAASSALNKAQEGLQAVEKSWPLRLNSWQPGHRTSAAAALPSVQTVLTRPAAACWKQPRPPRITWLSGPAKR